jgi:exoribonuclease R
MNIYKMFPLQTKDYKTFQAGSIIFEGALKAKKALPGDLVNQDLAIIKRAEHTNIVGVLELASKTRYGFTSKQVPIYIFIPWNEAYPPFYVGSSHKDLTKNVIAVVDFNHWLSPANCPRGNCRRIIGPCGSIDAEEEALLLHTCSERWINNALNPLENPLIPIQGGTGLNDSVITFHVDPEGCRDIDDAISLFFTDSGDLEVRIHIADVASTLLTNPWLLKKAENIGQTVYRDGKVLNSMLPELLQEKLSLLPFQYRQTITLAFTWNIDKKVDNIRWYQQEIMVKESYTYETILNSKYADVLKILTSDLAQKDLEDSHDWIAELMLLYNKEVAKILRKNGVGILRRHGAPDLELLGRLESIGVAPKHLAYKSGEYCLATEPDVGHWGLQTDVYCHASSPIRRWADCVNQMSLMKILFNEFVEPVEGDPYKLNSLAKKVKAYERDLVFLRVLLGTSEKVFDTVIVDVKESKVKVWVESWLRIVTVYEPVDNWTFKPEVGMKAIATVFYDAGKRNWKKRLVIRLKPLTN